MAKKRQRKTYCSFRKCFRGLSGAFGKRLLLSQFYDKNVAKRVYIIILPQLDILLRKRPLIFRKHFTPFRKLAKGCFRSFFALLLLHTNAYRTILCFFRKISNIFGSAGVKIINCHIGFANVKEVYA